MYKLLIVDDEELVRKAIINKLDWPALGFGEVREAEDGEQALEIALAFKPDVVLTDIRMPFMDGLDLAKQLTLNLPETKTIILSGHDEFEYAQEAIKHGVLEYILKPIRSVTLSEVMLKIKHVLDSEKKHTDYLSKLRGQLHQSLPLLKERFLNSLVNGAVKDKDINSRMDYLEISLPGDIFTVCVCEIDNTGNSVNEHDAEDIELLTFSVKNICEEIIGKNGYAFYDFNNRLVIIFSHNSIDDSAHWSETLYTLLELIRQNVENFLDTTVTIGAGNSVGKLSTLKESYKASLQALENKIILGKNKIYDIKDMIGEPQQNYYPAEMIGNLLQKLKLGAYQEVEAYTNIFFKELTTKRKISANNIRIILSDIITGTHKLLMEINNAQQSAETIDFTIYNNLQKYETINDIKPVLLSYLSHASSQIKAVRNSRNNSVTTKAQQYINENYQQEELSLNTVASHVSVSPGYLSILFRRETNETFVEYLTGVRMEKAKELLKTTPLKAYEVAYKVGYSDPHYFNLCFKKHTGLTPSDYKEGG